MFKNLNCLIGVIKPGFQGLQNNFVNNWKKFCPISRKLEIILLQINIHNIILPKNVDQNFGQKSGQNCVKNLVKI